MSNNSKTVRRFFNRQWTGGLGWVLFLFGGLMTALMIVSLPGEQKISMAVVTVLVAIVSAAVTLAGLRMLLMRWDRMRFSREWMEVRLFGVTLQRIPVRSVRSVIGTVREYRSGLKDHQVYTLSINYDTPKGKERSVLMERSEEADEAIRIYLTHATILL